VVALQVPAADNYFTALNSAVFSDGSFVYIPKGVTSPMELSTYFRINASNTGQFERTLIIAEEDSHVSYLEGCTAPAYDDNQLHAAVVELSAAAGAEIKYSTVQNWYAGDKEGKGGIFNFVTKRGLCHGAKSKISWTQVCVATFEGRSFCRTLAPSVALAIDWREGVAFLYTCHLCLGQICLLSRPQNMVAACPPQSLFWLHGC
jgi:SUF system FeS cluster assembly, SufBD